MTQVCDLGWLFGDLRAFKAVVVVVAVSLVSFAISKYGVYCLA